MRHVLLLLLIICSLSATATAQSANTGSLRGVVTLDENGTALHNVSVSILQLRMAVETNEEGAYQIDNIPPGTYDVLAHIDRFPDVVRRVKIQAGVTTTQDLVFKLNESIKEVVTVTATDSEQTAFQSLQAVTALDSTELVQRAHTSIGEVLDNQPGVAKRSFGPGSSRPVIRSFDGDRVLVTQDGVRSGSLASQSGDHGETINPLGIDRIEIVKGPATLLYGSNALGGVVNAITGHHESHDHPHSGLRGYATSLGGSNNNQGGGNFGLEYGRGNFLFFGNGGGQRTGDYDTRFGAVPNSKTRASNGTGGFGYYGDRTYFSFSYGYDDGRYGIPFAAQFEGGEEEERAAAEEEEEEFIDLAYRRHNGRLNFGVRGIDTFFEQFRFSLNYSDYRHRELENGEPNTIFDNREYVYRGTFQQQAGKRISGTFGFSGLHRNYDVTGAEALAPPVDQNTFALFALEEINLEPVKIQLGGRAEHVRYNAQGLRDREFTGLSAAAGIRVPLFKNAAFVANFTSSYRAPALEELYNNGPHIGTLTFEIGNENLRRERADGIDFALRYSGERVRAEANFFYYSLRDFVFLAPTGNIEDGLIEANYAQANTRYLGTELGVDLSINKYLSMNMGLDAVDAELKDSGTPLPRITPLRGRIGIEGRYKGFTIRPEVIMARDQDQIFPTETRTAGYTVVNLRATYTVVKQHFVHIFSVNAFNLGDRLYRNHLSFIKDLAPEIGRGVRFAYTVRFF